MHSLQMQTLSCLTVVLWKYQVFWEMQSSVTTDEVHGLHEIFKFIKEKSAVSEDCIKTLTLIFLPFLLFFTGSKLRPRCI